MTAREMFEALGYEYKHYKQRISYSKTVYRTTTLIVFDLKTKQAYCECGMGLRAFNSEESKAVQQQKKELGWLEEEKQETNFEHYFEYLSKIKMMDFALVDGRVVQCLGTHCGECDFNGDCIERKFKWLKQPYEKPKYELSQFEYDLINTFDRCKECCLLNEIECIKKLREKGYFNGIDPFTKVHDIIDNCEVIE